MSPLVVVLATLGLIVLSAFFVIMEFAFLGARRHRLEVGAETSGTARAALRSINELTVMLAGAQLGITACTFALGAVTKPAVDAGLGPLLSSAGLPAGVAGGASFVISLLLVTFLHLVVGEMAPKSWAIAHPETSAKAVALPARAFITLVRPVLVLINNIANRLVAASGVEPVDRAAVGGQDVDTIRQLVEHSAHVGALESGFHRQLSEVLELERLTLGDLAHDTEPLQRGATVGDALEEAGRTGHMRLVVNGDDARYVHVRDLLDLEPGSSLSDHVRPALSLAPDRPVYEALEEMRGSGDQLVVVDRGEGGVGVVTITDIMSRVLPSASQRADRVAGGAP